jgi:hypothetical protein
MCQDVDVVRRLREDRWRAFERGEIHPRTKSMKAMLPRGDYVVSIAVAPDGTVCGSPKPFELLVARGQCVVLSCSLKYCEGFCKTKLYPCIMDKLDRCFRQF